MSHVLSTIPFSPLVVLLGDASLFGEETLSIERDT